MPSIIEFKTGKILAWVNIPLHDIPLRSMLTDRIGVPVYVENDAGCAALAEAFDDGKIVVDSLVMLTIGTGVGGGWVLKGACTAGRRPRPPRSGTRSSGATSSSATTCPATRSRSAGRWRRWPRDARWTGWPTTRRCSTRTRTWEDDGQEGRVDGHDVAAGAEAGDDAWLWCLRVLGERIGIGIANAINTFDPLEVVMGGGVSRAGSCCSSRPRTPRSATSCPGWA